MQTQFSIRNKNGHLHQSLTVLQDSCYPKNKSDQLIPLDIKLRNLTGKSLKTKNCGMNANLEIISDLKDFITLSATQPDLKELFTVSKNDCSRNRKLGFERLVLMLINFFRKSYSNEITDFFLISGEENKVTKSAFCQQRMKIKDLFFPRLKEIMVESFYRHYAEQVKRWNGFRLIAIDGSIAC
ncbi:MAG: hypothetical protein ABIP95_06445 [Pelobium sp.]